MPLSTNPYDELPYASFPIEWTAPERLAAIASMLHGGARGRRWRSIGCSSSAAEMEQICCPWRTFGGTGPLSALTGRRAKSTLPAAGYTTLALSNVELIHADFLTAHRQLCGRFDYIIAHGVFSWVPHDVRDALLELCTKPSPRRSCSTSVITLVQDGTCPGLVREFLIAQTSGAKGLRAPR